jgi:threonyl-tRNA synthetase
MNLDNGYQLAVSPHIGLSNLWQTSGHLGFYKENMFNEMKVDNRLRERCESMDLCQMVR